MHTCCIILYYLYDSPYIPANSVSSGMTSYVPSGTESWQWTTPVDDMPPVIMHGCQEACWLFKISRESQFSHRM